MSGYRLVENGDEKALQASLVSIGPIAVAIDGSHKSLQFYSHGIYYEYKCSNKELTHCK